jgi:hypothetical protein
MTAAVGALTLLTHTGHEEWVHPRGGTQASDKYWRVSSTV